VVFLSHRLGDLRVMLSLLTVADLEGDLSRLRTNAVTVLLRSKNGTVLWQCHRQLKAGYSDASIIISLFKHVLQKRQEVTRLK